MAADGTEAEGEFTALPDDAAVGGGRGGGGHCFYPSQTCFSEKYPSVFNCQARMFEESSSIDSGVFFTLPLPHVTLPSCPISSSRE